MTASAPRVLFLTHQPPLRTSGGNVATLGVVQALQAAEAALDLVMDVAHGDRQLMPAVEAAFPGVDWGERSRATPSCVLRWAAEAPGLGYWPRWCPAVWKRLRRRVEAGRYRAIVLDHARMAEYGRLLKAAGCRVPIILRAHNVEHRLLRDLRRSTRPFGKRLELEFRLLRYGRIEAHLDLYCDRCLAISDVDAASLVRLNPGFPVESFPSPVDFDYYAPAAGGSEDEVEIVFIGGLRWAPNRDAVEWLVREILPALLEQAPTARLSVIGTLPAGWALHHPRVTYHGFVADERPLVRRAAAVVVPVRFGSGVRIKILNSLAMAKAVVSTTLGAEGIPVRHGHSILLADDARSFAGAVSGLLRDGTRRTALGQAGRETCLGHFAISAAAQRLKAILGEAPGAPGPHHAAGAPPDTGLEPRRCATPAG